MKRILFIDFTKKSGEIWQAYNTVEFDFRKVAGVEEAVAIITEEDIHYLFWHLSSAFYNNDEPSSLQLNEICEFMEIACGAKLPGRSRRFGVSGSPEYRKQGQKTNWFRAVQDWEELEKMFEDRSFEKAEQRLAVREEAERLRTIIYEILYLFLPLHIQLQLEDQESNCRTEASNVLVGVRDVLMQYRADPSGSSVAPIEFLKYLIGNMTAATELCEKANASFAKLVKMVDRIKGYDGLYFDGFRRQIFGEGIDGLREEGFHRTYERLRDELLGIVYAVEDQKV